MNNHLKALEEKVIIRGTVKPLTALHIGSQRSFDPVDSDAPVIKDPAGNPYIPGSSFKGVLRSFIEGFLGGADLKEGLRPCCPTDDDPCVKPEKWNEQDTILKDACPVCRIFGSSFMGPKLKIKDMPILGEWNNTFYRIRDGVVIDRDSRTARDKGKYDFEIVSPGVEFSLEMIGDNLKDYEKGLIFTAFDLISEGFGALGGNVSRGTGRIAITISGIEILKPKNFFTQYLQNKEGCGTEKIATEDIPAYKAEMIKAFIQYFKPEVSHV